MNLNKVQLIGRVGKDPELKTLSGDLQVATFTMATNENWRDKDGNMVEKTEWHSIVAWGNLAKIADKYIHKGDLVYVEGKITTRSYEKDGVKRYITNIVANNIQFGSRSAATNADLPDGIYEKTGKLDESGTKTEQESDDLPF